MRSARAVPVVLFVLYSSIGSAQDGTTSAPTGPDWVGVSTSDAGVVLATQALRRYGLPWATGEHFRFRVIPVEKGRHIDDARLSADGTCLMVALSAGESHRIDLTKPIAEVPRQYHVAARCEETPPKGQFADAHLLREANAHLDARFPASKGAHSVSEAWALYRPTPPDERSYAPALLLAPLEPVKPSTFEVWTSLPNGMDATTAKKASGQQELLRRYLAAAPSCNVYWRRTPLRGSWLLEYWLYYPFDYGFGGHLHDSEHLFVEVDRLGGAVRRVAGAGHGMWAANSIYHTFDAGTPPISLPLQALVEYGKHATAPDIDRDGIFTPGFDSNIHWDASKVWGIRDATGNTDSSLRRFEGSMAVPRSKGTQRQVLTVKSWPYEEPGLEASSQCDLTELPARGQNDRTSMRTACDGDGLTSAACARHKMESNFDYRRLDAILKPSAFPRRFIRLGLGHWVFKREDQAHHRLTGLVTLSGGIELGPLLAKWIHYPIPGRVVGEIRSFADDNGRPSWRPASWSLSYERLGTNLLGIYGGVTNNRRPQPGGDTDGQESLVGAGLLIELPLPVVFPAGRGSGLNLFAKVGIQTDGTSGIGAAWRAGLGYGFGSQFRRFGIRGRDGSPY